MTRRLRVLLTLLLTAILALSGASISYALWATSATVSSTASTASVTVAHTLSGSSLAVAYSATTTSAVGVITVTNTGTRDGSYSLALTAASASGTMRAATAVEIGTATSCTATATLSGAVAGTFAATITTTGSISAGASVALCVRTSMTAAAVTANASAALAASVATSITVGTWSASPAAPIAFTQSVIAPSDFQSIDGNRYRILNQSVCLGTDWAFSAIARGTNCENDQTSNWRLTTDLSGAKVIARAYNTDTAPDNRWNASSASAVGLASAAATSAQRWMITIRADNVTYQIQSVAQSKCVAVASTGAVSLETCNAASAGQGFTFEVVANSAPPAVSLSCGGNGSNFIHFTWPVLTGYEAEVTYRVYIDGVLLRDHSNGYWTTVQIYAVDLPPTPKTVGTHTVQVRQSVSGGAYTVTGDSSYAVASGTLNLTCG